MKTNNPKLQVADLILNPEKLDAFLDETPLELPPLSFQLFYALATKAPEIVPAQELIETVWPDVAVSDDTLKQRVSLLRETLKKHNKAGIIGTIRGQGYRIAAPVTQLQNKGGYPAPTGILKILPLIIALTTIILGILYVFKRDPAFEHNPIRVVLLPAEATSIEITNLRQQLIRELSLTSSIIPVAPQAVQAKQHLNPRQLARTFGASVLVNTTMENSAKKIALQFIDPSTNTIVWSQTYSKTALKNADITAEIAAELHARFGLTDEDNKPITRILSAADYKTYLTAISLSEKADANSLSLAITNFEALLKKYPDFHLARAFLASAQAEMVITFNGSLWDADAALRNAHAAATAAPTLAEAYFAYGKAALARREYQTAENAFKKAELLMPYLKQKSAPYRQKIVEK